MKFKKSVIALAIAGIAAAPIVAQAGGSFYASARIGLQSLDTLDESEITVRGFAARMGVKGESDLGNGMTGFGKYEWAVGTEGTSENVTRRHAYVGLKGDFGKVTLGQTYHTFYNMVYGPTDLPWWGAGYAVVLSPGRTSQGLSYFGDFGAVSFGATVYMNGSATTASGGSEDIDQIEAAVSFDAGPVTIGIGISDAEGDLGGGGTDPDAVTMVTVSNIPAGPVSLVVGYQTQDVGTLTETALILDAGFGGGYVHVELLDEDNGIEPSSITLGYTQSLGPQTTAWYEYQIYDADDNLPAATSDDADYIRAVLKVDFD